MVSYPIYMRLRAGLALIAFVAALYANLRSEHIVLIFSFSSARAGGASDSGASTGGKSSSDGGAQTGARSASDGGASTGGKSASDGGAPTGGRSASDGEITIHSSSDSDASSNTSLSYDASRNMLQLRLKLGQDDTSADKRSSSSDGPKDGLGLHPINVAPADQLTKAMEILQKSVS